MSRIKEITVTLDLTVQPKQYQSIKLGISVTQAFDESECTAEGTKTTDMTAKINELRGRVSDELIAGLHQEVERVYGKVTADYVINQTGSQK